MSRPDKSETLSCSRPAEAGDVTGMNNGNLIGALTSGPAEWQETTQTGVGPCLCFVFSFRDPTYHL